ncbi:Uncharacterized protein TCM_009765 [Theobroma cacao]|uniref:Uncharacterized protein n=1 Tax=Theobroma cacao TaxID=3641 RepID=A0A061ED28_THECC|nr:Uncharacterized protein TCM_009765 [Theobroma cacao]
MFLRVSLNKGIMRFSKKGKCYGLYTCKCMSCTNNTKGEQHEVFWRNSINTLKDVLTNLTRMSKGCDEPLEVDYPR